jgi:hypothetical protein
MDVAIDPPAGAPRLERINLLCKEEADCSMVLKWWRNRTVDEIGRPPLLGRMPFCPWPVN